MPAPLAKGLIVTFSVLVAAGVAVYQSPQFQEWVTTSRRKIALALHNLGDEIQPRDLDAIQEDISMSEEVGEAAEERRRIARAEIMRRVTLLESRRQPKDSDKPRGGSFDTLVDNDGNLRMADDKQRDLNDNSAGASTGIDMGSTQPLHRGVKSNQASIANQKELDLDTFSGAVSNHPSESDVQLTPTSETPGEVLFDPFSDSPTRAPTPVSVSASSHTEGDQVYYAHPNPPSNFSNPQDLLTDLEEMRQGNQFQHPVSSAPSTAGSYSHVGDFDEMSDGTLSDLGAHSVGGVATPVSWSEVGSVISNDDAGHHQI